MNESIVIALGQNMSAIPIEMVQNVGWKQFFISLLFGSIGIFFFFGSSITLTYNKIKSSIFLKLFCRLTNRHTLLVNHFGESLFGNNQMIDGKCAETISRFLSYHNGNDVNIILRSPGGAVFHASHIAKMFDNYKGKIHLYVNHYAMSGGTLLSLAADHLYMSPNAVLGRVDPQIGGIFGSNSAGELNDLLKYKGKKVDDKNIMFAKVSKKVENSIYDLILKLTNNKKLTKFLTRPGKEHIYQIDKDELRGFGYEVKDLDGKLLLFANQLVFSANKVNYLASKMK